MITDMKKWEYIRCSHEFGLSDEQLNDYGNYGWELYTVYNSRLAGQFIYLWKRELENKDEKTLDNDKNE